MSGHTPLPALPIELPMLPLRDVVVFPHMVIPLFVGRPKSIKALEAAMETDRSIMLVAQKAAAKDEPLVSDMFEVGCDVPWTTLSWWISVFRLHSARSALT